MHFSQNICFCDFHWIVPCAWFVFYFSALSGNRNKIPLYIHRIFHTKCNPFQHDPLAEFWNFGFSHKSEIMGRVPLVYDLIFTSLPCRTVRVKYPSIINPRKNGFATSVHRLFTIEILDFIYLHNFNSVRQKLFVHDFQTWKNKNYYESFFQGLIAFVLPVCHQTSASTFHSGSLISDYILSWK